MWLRVWREEEEQSCLWDRVFEGPTHTKDACPPSGVVSPSIDPERHQAVWSLDGVLGHQEGAVFLH